jgi:hypothetical protein
VQTTVECDQLLAHIATTEIVRVPIDALRAADSPRSSCPDAGHVEVLLRRAGAVPALVVHRPTMRVIDGMHRLEAAIRRGDEDVAVRFFDGAARDCFPLAVRLNAAHGLPLSTRDRVAAAVRILNSHAHWSDRAIAAITGVSPKTVAARRSSEDRTQLNVRTGRDGRTRDSDIGARRRAAASYLVTHPEASLREIAGATGISLGTARDVRLRVCAGADAVPDGQRRRDHPGGLAPALPPPVAPPHRLSGAPDADDVVAALRLDPALRMTDSGRVLLRIVEANRALTSASGALATCVPRHCAEAVAVTARRFAEVWGDFADELEHGRPAVTRRVS